MELVTINALFIAATVTPNSITTIIKLVITGEHVKLNDSKVKFEITDSN